jgi:lactoylglutathione lyase
MITRIGHAAIWARDIEATAAFYRDVLGMPEAFRMQNPAGDKPGSVHIFVAANQFIEIFPLGVEHDALPEHAIGHAHLCFEVDNAARSIEEIRARGAPIDTELKLGYSKCIQFWTHDPDGNSIELMELPPDCMQIAATKRLSKAVAND